MPGVVITAAAIGAVAGAAGLVTFTVAGSAILGGALLYGGLAAATHLLTPSLPSFSGGGALAAGGTASRTVTLAASAPAQWILGRARVAGVLTWYREDPENDRVVDVVIALSEGPCSSLQKLWVDGEEVPLVLAHVSEQPVDALRYQPDAPPAPEKDEDEGEENEGDGEEDEEEEEPRDYRGRLEVWFYRTGVAGRAPTSLAAVDPEYWTAERHGADLCFVHVRLTQNDWEDSEDPSTRFWQAFPAMSFLVKGLQVPRPTTLPNGEPGFETGVEWSDNAAAIRYWYERERRGRPATAIDGAYLNRAYTICDETLDTVERDFFDHRFPEAIQIKRYSINGLLRSDDNLDSISREFDFAWQGHIAERDGKLLFLPGTDELLSAAGITHMDVAETGLVRFLGAQPSPSLSERINSTSGVMAQAGRAQWLEYEVSQSDHRLIQERDGAVRSQDVPMRWLQWESAAHRLLSKHLRSVQRTSIFEYLLPPGDDFRHVLISPGDTFLLTDIDRGLERSRVMVVSQTVEPDWSVRLTVLLTPSGTFSDDLLAEVSREGDPASTVPESQPRTDNTRPDHPSNIGILTDGTMITLWWRGRGLATTVQVREATGNLRESINNPGPNAVSRTLAPGSDRITVDLAETQGLRERVHYIIEIRSRGATGLLSAPFYTEAYLSLPASDPPPQPEGLEASASSVTSILRVQWTPIAGHQTILTVTDVASFGTAEGTVTHEETVEEETGEAVVDLSGLRTVETGVVFRVEVRFRRISDGARGPSASVDAQVTTGPVAMVAAPTQLMATAQGTLITITWQHIGRATIIEMTAAPPVARRLPRLTSPRGDAVVDAADFQSPETTVVYTLSARHLDSNGRLGEAATTTVSVTRGAIAPTAQDVPRPTALSVTPAGTTLTINWRPVDFETVVEVSAQGGGATIPDVTVGASESSAVIDVSSAQESGTTVTYDVTVRHLSDDGDTGPTASRIATISILDPPPVPTGVVASVAGTALTVSWDLPRGLTARVELVEVDPAKSSDALYRAMVETRADIHFHTFNLETAQAAGTTVTYEASVRYVRAEDGQVGGRGVVRAQVIRPAVTGPEAPAQLRGTAGDTFISARWRPLAGHVTLITMTELDSTKQAADLFTATRTVADGVGAVSIARPAQNAGDVLVVRVTAQYRRVSDSMTGETARLTMRLTRAARAAIPTPTALVASVSGSLLTLRWQGHGYRARLVYTATGQQTQTRNVSSRPAGETSSYGLDMSRIQPAGTTATWTVTVTLYQQTDGPPTEGTSASAMGASVTVPAAGAPPAPASLLVIVVGRTITVTWSATAGLETIVRLTERPQPGASGTPHTETMISPAGGASVDFDVTGVVADSTLTRFDLDVHHRRASDMVLGPTTQREAVINELPVAPTPQGVTATVSNGTITVAWQDQGLRTLVRGTSNSQSLPVAMRRIGRQLDPGTSQVVFAIRPYLRSGASAEYTLWTRHRNAAGQSGPAVRRTVTVT